MKDKYVCAVCGHVGTPKKGLNPFDRAFLKLVSFIGFLGSWIFKLLGRKWLCTECEGEMVVPINSSRGQEVLKQFKQLEEEKKTF